jgi:serine/threonine protein kinase
MSEDVLYNILFQIIYSLCSLSKYKINHNDLRTDNIMIQKTDLNEGYYKYVINDKEYYLPNYGFQIKIIDFGLSIFNKFNKYNENEFESMDSIGILQLYSPYYDLHTIINEIYLKSQFIYDKYPNFFKFLLDIVDIKYLGNDNKYINMYWRLYFPYKYDYYIKHIPNMFYELNSIKKDIIDKSYLSTIKTPEEAIKLFTMYLSEKVNIIDTYIVKIEINTP